VLISHFPKPKEASYFLLIGNAATNDILAIKRVSFNRYTSKQLSVALPRDFRTEKLELYLMCDSYIGLDQYHQIDLSDVNDYLQGGATKPRAKGLEQFSAYSQLK
jgi:pre-mRNA-splicing helicase BRR2